MTTTYEIVFDYGKTLVFEDMMQIHKPEILRGLADGEDDIWVGDHAYDINVWEGTRGSRWSDEGKFRFAIYPVIDGSPDTNNFLACGILEPVCEDCDNDKKVGCGASEESEI